MANKTITVKLVKSVITHPENVRATVRGLGLTRLGAEKTLENTPAVRGMIKKVINLLEIKEN